VLAEPFITKFFVISIAVAMYGLAYLKHRMTNVPALLSFMFLCFGAPLGYDTLMYSFLIESGGISNYGPLWATLGAVANWANAWWIVHFFTYTLIVYAFVRLARQSTWPSLALATLTTMPGLGFDFLSVIRQGLSTAFIILFYLALKESRTTKSLLFSTLAFFAHPAGLFAVTLLLLARFKSNLKHVALYILIALGTMLTVSLTLPDHFESQVNNVFFLFTRYLLSDNTIENETGVKLFIAWSIILLTPLIIAALTRRVAWFSMEISSIVLFLACYGLLLAVSGSSVRLIWFFLPVIMMTVISTLNSGPRHRVLMPTRLFFTAICFAASAYVLSIAPEHFWAGEYPHEIHFIK
jgi:hypothetical protein